ncbi:HTH domain-containing protein [Paramaledivibacter caminithermalis]|jgi:predicted DNA-binding transcriptional regulator YafY|uniref:HTH domain-containing protein n=1 Tax=Paramaledivibacter caminithermalis (strain DSM 15212 / CIP 107654 / DViRD3) TaxID=1121301 RepID=A0A1M6M1L2_PARC5|nr:HTH domain-containing protein [Paramaledivibacter caminithermalis]SHJ77348.1 HTH domain-containing protein [Paramaledivibacter caminithermalis DSM 15212]
MGPNERRMEIIEVLCKRRQDTMSNLAFEFGVSIRTIKNDIDILSLSYPIETIRGRYGGGVKVADGYYLNRKYLKPKQQELLERLRTSLSGNDLAVMNSILKDFALNY